MNKRASKWPHIAGVGLVCGLALSGCSRNDGEESEAIDTSDASTSTTAADNNNVAPAIRCDNPMVQDRLKSAIESTLERQAQSFAANYASSSGIDLDDDIVEDKIDSIVIDIQNTAILQEANSNGMTTCQASVSMTLASEDLYQASQFHSANNTTSLQTRLAQNNIRVNNNMLIDDAFTYVVGAQNGQVRVRIAGQPPLLNIVSDIMAGSAYNSVASQIQAERQAQEQAARRREIAQRNAESQVSREPIEVTPLEPTRPAEPTRSAEPATPPTINQGSNQSNSQSNNQAATSPNINERDPVTPKVPKLTPNDDTIDMVIVEDESATY